MNVLSRRGLGICIATLSLLSLAVMPARAGDHFLAIGGGDSTHNNQISLEKNVLFFQRLLVDCQGQGVVPDVLFSDGQGQARDVQFAPPEEPPRLNVLLARLFGREYDLNWHYRKHEINGIKGPSTHQGLEAWFNSEGKKLGDGDRLLIYFTGHGGAGRPAENTTISMWNQNPMQMTEFTKLLDRLSPKVNVVLVMVQCHSGGFAGTIFKDGKAGADLSPARRCGFFATKYDRNAAGCTPDTAEEDYKDYSTYFFAALDGKTRGGKPVQGCDLDGDGRITFAEAHAYTLLHSDTIDIPTTTSEALLRQYSKSSGNWMARPDMSFNILLSRASVPARAVLEGLSQQLKLSSEDRYTEAKRLADMFEAQRKTAEQDRQKKAKEADDIGQRIRGRLLQHWPELANPWSAVSVELMTKDAVSLQEAIDKDSDAPAWELARRDVGKFDDQAFALERRWVKCQRMIRQLETTALAANIEKVAKPAVIERYKQMLEDEAGTLSPNSKVDAVR